MPEATIITQTTTRRVFACPECGEPWGSSYEHVKPGQEFGPWYCDHCGHSVRGIVTSDGVTLEPGANRLTRTLVLLRLDVPTEKPIHIVVKGMLFHGRDEDPEAALSDQQEKDTYFYNEHTCPWNYLRLPIKEGDDCDPHGLFVHQETILMPKGYTNHIDEISSIHGIDAWRELFASLREPEPCGECDHNWIPDGIGGHKCSKCGEILDILF